MSHEILFLCIFFKQSQPLLASWFQGFNIFAYITRTLVQISCHIQFIILKFAFSCCPGSQRFFDWVKIFIFMVKFVVHIHFKHKVLLPDSTVCTIQYIQISEMPIIYSVYLYYDTAYSHFQWNIAGFDILVCNII